jgi:hypothetical protein
MKTGWTISRGNRMDSAESAVVVLGFLERHFPVNAAIEQRIRELAK